MDTHDPTCKSCGTLRLACDHGILEFRKFLSCQDLPSPPSDWKQSFQAVGIEQAIVAEAKSNYFVPALEKDWECGLLTINPNSANQRVKYLLKVWQLLCAGNRGVKMMMCIEQRSTDIDQPHGYHMHIAVERTVKQNNNSYKKFKEWVMSNCIGSAVNFKTCQKRLFKNFEAYLKKEGERSEEQKLKSIVDKKIREKFQLENIYVSGGGGGIN